MVEHDLILCGWTEQQARSPEGKGGFEMVPVDVLDDLLEESWQSLCASYDVTESMPDLQTMFAGVDLSDPWQAAEVVLANMLVEVIDCTHRFSPWYRMSARAFGLIRVRETTTARSRWMLAPEAVQRWISLIESLATAIRMNTVLIQATQIIEDAIRQHLPEEEEGCVVAQCQCQPRHTILIDRAVLKCSDIVCGDCHQPYRPTSARSCDF